MKRFKQRTLTWYLPLLLLLLAALWLYSFPRSGQLDDVREAVFRYQFAHGIYEYPSAQGPKVFFLALDNDRDPSDDFMRRFLRNHPPVKKVSQCHFGAPRDPEVKALDTSVVLDKETGAEGVIFRVERIRCPLPFIAIVDGGYYAAGLAGSQNRYYMLRKYGQWVVIRDKLLLII